MKATFRYYVALSKATREPNQSEPPVIMVPASLFKSNIILDCLAFNDEAKTQGDSSLNRGCGVSSLNWGFGGWKKIVKW